MLLVWIVLLAPAASVSDDPSVPVSVFGVAVSVVAGDWHAMEALLSSLIHRRSPGFVHRFLCSASMCVVFYVNDCILIFSEAACHRKMNDCH